MEEKKSTDSVNSAYPHIRTMAEDLARAKKEAPAVKKEELKNAASKSSPPAGLPVVGKDQSEDKTSGETTVPKPPFVPGSQAPEKKVLPKPAQPSKKDKEVKKGKKAFPKLLLIFLGAVIIVGGLGGFFYWYNYLNQPALPIQEPVTHFECLDNQCVEIEGEGVNGCFVDLDCQEAPVEPEPLLSVDSTQTIELNGSLAVQLKNILKREQDEKELVRILIKEREGDYFDLESLAKELNLKFSSSVTSLVSTSSDDHYMLFSCSQEPENRLGLAIKIQGYKDLSAGLRAWESQMPSDLRPLLMKDEALSASDEHFLDNTYLEVDIRYLNFPTADLSIDYIQFGNKLIFATSKQCMFETIERLQEQN